MISGIILLLIAIVFFVVLFVIVKSAMHLIINAVIGVVMFVISNALGITHIQFSIFNLLICAIGGIPGALVLIILNAIGLY